MGQAERPGSVVQRSGGRLGRHRQGKRERRADTLLRLDPDPAAVLLDDVPGDRQAETGPASLTLTVTSPPPGLNLTALWRRLTKTWPSRSSSPRIGGRSSSSSRRRW